MRDGGNGVCVGIIEAKGVFRDLAWNLPRKLNERIGLKSPFQNQRQGLLNTRQTPGI
jgi:hypothetical protein